MSLSAAILDALLASGATREMIAAAMKADIAERAAVEEARLAAKREGNRERQRRFKGARKAKVTPNNAGNSDNALADVTPPPNDKISNPPPVTPTKPSGLEPKPKKHRLPADWEPRPFKPGSMAALTIIRWEPGRMERELSKFRDHHTAAGSRFECWQAAWSKWVNNSDDFQRGRPGGGHHQHLGKTATAIAGLGDWHDERPM